MTRSKRLARTIGLAAFGIFAVGTWRTERLMIMAVWKSIVEVTHAVSFGLGWWAVPMWMALLALGFMVWAKTAPLADPEEYREPGDYHERRGN